MDLEGRILDVVERRDGRRLTGSWRSWVVEEDELTLLLRTSRGRDDVTVGDKERTVGLVGWN